MNLVFMSHLYPNSIQPGLAPYNRQLIGALAGRRSDGSEGPLEMRVIAPVFTFPGECWFGGMRLPPEREELDGIPTLHPRVVRLPGFWVHRHWMAYRRIVGAALGRLAADSRPDHVMIGFAYPDAVALAPVCRRMGIRYSIRVNGSDFRLRIRQPRFRAMVLEVLRSAPLVLCPGQALKRDMAVEGVTEDRIVAFRNGVDREHFRARDRAEVLTELRGRGIEPPAAGRLVLYTGNLVSVKGLDRLLEAWRLVMARTAVSGVSAGRSEYSPPQLVLLGDGSGRDGLIRLARRLGIADSVKFAGNRPHGEMGLWMNLADCLVLPSHSEGMPNAVLEAMGCGCPVVATDVGEIPFLIRDDENGYRVRADGADVAAGLAGAIERALGRVWDRGRLAREADVQGWDETAGALLSRGVLLP